jgi:PAS domain S-box-containing protein
MFLFGLLALLMLAGATSVSRWIVLTGFERVEREHVRSEVRHATRLVEDSPLDLAARFEDWSSWDDPYEFVENPQQRFIDSNVQPGMLTTARIDAIAFVHRSGRVIYATSHDRATGENRPLAPELANLLPEIVGIASDERSVFRGLVALPDGVMMVIANPLLTSSRQGPCRGKLVIGRLLGAQELDRLSRMSRLGMWLRPLGSAMLQDDAQAVWALEHGSTELVQMRDDGMASGYGRIVDLHGTPVALLRVDVPRSIISQGRQSTFASTVAIVLTAIPFIALALVLLVSLERARAAVSQRERYYRALIDGGSDLIVILGQGRRVRYHSPAVEHILGREMIGNDMLACVDPADHGTVQALLAQVEARPGEHARGTFRCLRADGEKAVVEAIVKNLQHDPAIEGVLINGRDVTEREQSARERALLEDELRQAQKLEAVGRLAGGVAHDFNNLLTVILGHADLLARLGLPAKAAEGIDALRAAAKRAAGLTQQLLSFSRKQVIAPRVLDLGQAVARSRDMLARLIGEDVKLEFRLSADACPVRVDPNQLDQVLLNLAANARDAMPDGGSLAISTSRQEVDEAMAATHAGLTPGAWGVLEVSDTGQGIKADDLPHIFEPFYTTKPVGKGTGMGLATVYGLVRQHGGVVLVDSTPGAGTTFRVLLPCCAPEPDPPAPSSRPAPATATGNVLLVEDDNALRDLACTFLRDAGFHVAVAADPRAALDLAAIERADVLVTDVIMPGMNGRELADALRGLLPTLRVLYVSGYTDTILQKIPELKASETFLQKPFSGALLVEKVSELMRRSG